MNRTVFLLFVSLAFTTVQPLLVLAQDDEINPLADVDLRGTWQIERPTVAPDSPNLLQEGKADSNPELRASIFVDADNLSIRFVPTFQSLPDDDITIDFLLTSVSEKELRFEAIQVERNQSLIYDKTSGEFRRIFFGNSPGEVYKVRRYSKMTSIIAAMARRYEMAPMLGTGVPLDYKQSMGSNLPQLLKFKIPLPVFSDTGKFLHLEPMILDYKPFPGGMLVRISTRENGSQNIQMVDLSIERGTTLKSFLGQLHFRDVKVEIRRGLEKMTDPKPETVLQEQDIISVWKEVSRDQIFSFH